MSTRQPKYPAAKAKADRESLGLTQAQLAERLEIAVSSVALYEGRGAPVWYRYALAGLTLEKADQHA